MSKNNFLTHNIESKIYLIRGMKVMIDSDLALLYGVTTKSLNQTVRRNPERFPNDFMFQLNETERDSFMRSQIVTASRHKVNLRYKPYAFTELGIAMLSGVLKSEQAIQVHISIIRVFFKLRFVLRTNLELSEKLEKIEKSSNHLFKIVFERLDSLEEKPKIPIAPTKRKLGF